MLNEISLRIQIIENLVSIATVAGSEDHNLVFTFE